MQQLPSKLLEICGGGRMEVSNLVVVTNSASNNNAYCRYCGGYSCSYRGQPNHLPLETTVTPCENSFYKDSTNWKLSGSGCFNFQNKFIHTNVIILPSKVKDNCKLVLELSDCPRQNKLELTRINKALVTLDFMNEKMGVVNTKHVRIAEMKKNPTNKLLSMDDQFCTTDVLRTLCQLNPEGSNRQSPYGLISKEYEFVSIYLKLRILLEPGEGVESFLNSSTCKSIDQYEVNIRAPFAAKIMNAVPLESNDEVDIEDATKLDLLQNQSKVTAVTKFTPEVLWKFTDRVNIKCGPSFKHSLSVHTDILTKKSSVFRTMLATKMLESETGEIKISNISPKVVHAFISFLYGMDDKDSMHSDVKLMVGVLELAHQYEISDLINDCVQILVSTKNEVLTAVDVLLVYGCGHKLEISDLQCRALQWFLENKDIISPEEQQEALAEFLQKENAAAVSLIIRLQAGFDISQ